MSRRRAPSDLRMPISWVRSVTLASMMFMITIPPTTMNTATSPMVTAKMRAGQVLPGAHQRIGGVDAESVVLMVGDVAAGAHQGADLVLEFHACAGVRRLDEDQEFRARRPRCCGKCSGE